MQEEHQLLHRNNITRFQFLDVHLPLKKELHTVEQSSACVKPLHILSLFGSCEELLSAHFVPEKQMCLQELVVLPHLCGTPACPEAGLNLCVY